MKDKDYKMLEEAYTKIKENHSLDRIPPTEGNEWHNLSGETPENPDSIDLMNPDFSDSTPDMEDDGDELTDELINIINRHEEQHGEGKPDTEDLAIAVAKVIKELYGSHNKQPFIDHFTKQFN